MLGCFLLVYCLGSATCSGLLSRHRRTWVIDTFTIEEGHPGPFPYELGKIKVAREYQVQFDLVGEGVDEEPKGVLSINKETGMVLVHKPVDYEENKTLKLKFEAKKTDSSTDTKLGVEISIRDINDNPPLFQRNLYEISLAEEAVQGSHILTVAAYDRDQRGTPNSTFHYEINSVAPNPPNTEFFINEIGAISFKGCLDHEVAEMFTVLVEAKDHGEVISLSSSTTVIIHIQDGNNHLPVIRGQSGSGKVKEDETGNSPLRIHVTDKDSPNSPAWRAKYTIEDDEGGHFKIETDPDTNDGILTVIKPLDFEGGAQRQLTISVENEMPYFYCEVKEQTSSGLWVVDTGTGEDTGVRQPHSIVVLIEVEDTNDPPAFSVTVKDATLVENAPIGTWVAKVTAVDPDSSHARDFVYKMGDDPAGWMTVDPQTGDITTIKIPDRESSYVVDGVYTILLNAVDNGSPPLTGTATLNIHVMDQNDNVPQPKVANVDACVSDSPTTTNITAFDQDENPFGGPFSFELQEDVKGKWKLNPSHGYSAGLVKEASVYVGLHTVDLKITDMQGKFGVYKISITVCDCAVTPNCRVHRDTAMKAAPATIVVAFASLLLLMFMLLLAVKVSCKKEFTTLQTNDSFGETLLASNIETPGTDCKLPEGILAAFTDKKDHNPSVWQSQHDGMQQGQVSTKNTVLYSHSSNHKQENLSYLFSENWNQTTWNPLVAHDYHDSNPVEDLTTMNLYNRNIHYEPKAAYRAVLQQMLSSLQEEELLDYEPHIYEEEGDSGNLSELESISIPDDQSLQKTLKDLGPKFKTLASICKPPHLQN